MGFPSLIQNVALILSFSNITAALTTEPLKNASPPCWTIKSSGDSENKPLFNINSGNLVSRRNVISCTFTGFLLSSAISPTVSLAGTFTPGGTLVDRELGVTVGNSEASPSRKVDNSNVLFAQDNYFKFGVAAPWIEPDSIDFPKAMPFVLTQQRYDTLKKYGDRVKKGIQVIEGLNDVISAGNYGTIQDADDPKYALRPFGLLANGFLGSDNTGTTNELLLARWYINEIYLRIGDIQHASSKEEAFAALRAAKNSINSFLTMMNRVITYKVGNKFEYVS
mmetsp:Transcript_301/g.500  ORF Transcript_301/g.500 Transcript_301/m.500 type:complete len:280 (-) Transcript_301:42-881(-)